MSVLARCLALQGIGYGPRAMALQGLDLHGAAVAEPPRDIGSVGVGGVVSSATISLSEWLRLVEKRAATGLPPVALPIPVPVGADATGAALAARTRRRRREEELLLLIG